MNGNDIELESILKEELMQDISFDGELYSEKDVSKKPLKVEKKLAGLLNLGKTFFVNEAELAEKHNWAWYQVVQKYGDEICGTSAQNANQRTTSDDGTGTGTSSATSMSGGP